VCEWNTLCIEVGCVCKGQIQSLKFNSAKLKPALFLRSPEHTNNTGVPITRKSQST